MVSTALLVVVAPSGLTSIPAAAATDPPTLVVEEQALLTGATGREYFGTTVAIDGDTAVVGVPYENDYSGHGAAYVFVRTGVSWSQQAKLVASDGANYDWFGEAVAISGDTVMVGSPQDDVADNYDQGSVYVFTRSGTAWSERTRLSVSVPAADARFGGVVALDGGTALVTSAAGLFALTGSGSTWTEQQELVAPDGLVGDGFGRSLALSGDTALVGAPFDDAGDALDVGSAYVFFRSGATWGEQGKLLAPDGVAEDQLGYSVALDGDTAVVGANEKQIGAYDFQGAAYVFTRTGVDWVPYVRLTDEGGAAYAWFGQSVAISGDLVLVGAPWDGGWGNASAAPGSVSVFARSGAEWWQVEKLTAGDAAGGDRLGYVVGLSGDTALVGAPYDDVGSQPTVIEQGSARVFVLHSQAATTLALTTASNSSLDYGAAFAIEGMLKSSGVGLPGLTVVLQSAAPGQPFADTASTALTASGGQFVFSVHPTQKTNYRVRFAGTSEYLASGPTNSVFAVPRAFVGTPVAPETIPAGASRNVYGALKPRHPAGTYPVRIYKWRRTAAGWRAYGYVTARASNYGSYSRYSRSLVLNRAGKWRLRAFAPSDSLHAQAWSSGYDYVTVR
jgi:hypothetical protein